MREKSASKMGWNGSTVAEFRRGLTRWYQVPTTGQTHELVPSPEFRVRCSSRSRRSGRSRTAFVPLSSPTGLCPAKVLPEDLPSWAEGPKGPGWGSHARRSWVRSPSVQAGSVQWQGLIFLRLRKMERAEAPCTFSAFLCFRRNADGFCAYFWSASAPCSLAVAGDELPLKSSHSNEASLPANARVSSHPVRQAPTVQPPRRESGAAERARDLVTAVDARG